MNNLDEARRLADDVLSGKSSQSWAVSHSNFLARAFKELDAELARVNTVLEAVKWERNDLESKWAKAEAKYKRKDTALHKLGRFFSIYADAAEAQLRAMTQSRDEWKHRYGQMDDLRIVTEAQIKRLREPLATMLGAAEIDCLDDKSNVWRSAMLDACAALREAGLNINWPETKMLQKMAREKEKR